MSFWQRFEDYLADIENDSKEGLDSLLKFIDALEEPLELKRILDNLFPLFDALHSLRTFYADYEPSIYPSMWKNICLKLKLFPEFHEITSFLPEKRKMPLWGKYKSYPAYVAVWQQPGLIETRQKYYLLLAHCLIAVSILRDRMEEQKLSKLEISNYTKNILDSLLAVRNLAHPKSILDSFSNLWKPPKDLLAELKGCQDKITDPLVTLFNYLLDVRYPPRRKKGESKYKPGKRRDIIPKLDLPANSYEIDSNPDPGQEESALSIDLLQLPSTTEEQAKNIEQVGCSPNEDCSRNEIVSPRVKKADSREPKSATQKGRVKNRIKNQLALLNQRLVFRWELLSLYEVSTLLSAMTNLVDYKSRSRYLPDKAIPEELTALLVTMFWLGQRLEQAVGLTIYEEWNCTTGTKPGFVLDDNASGYWWVKPATPKRKKELSESQKLQAHETSNYFAISSGINIERLVRGYVNICHNRKKHKLFPRKFEEYDLMVREFLSGVNNQHGTRLTPARISDYVFDELAHQDSSDLTVAMYVTGREHFLGRNPSYYTSLSSSYLVKVYQETCKNIIVKHYKEQLHENDFRGEKSVAPILPELKAKYIGSPYRPMCSAVQNLVTELKTKLIDATQAETSVLKLMRLHNNMTRYTSFLIAFSTGFRAIRDPFLSSAEIDWNSGFAVLSDKDNEDGYNTRLIWLPQVCLDQLRFFREHQHSALFRFNILINNFHYLLGKLRRDETGRHMYFAKYGENYDDYVAVPIVPKKLGVKLEKLYSLPFNASRHYLRSSLLERKCPIEVINALMGHFERGEEPWGIYSGLSPTEYRNVLADKLEPILKEDGWEAIPGLTGQV